MQVRALREIALIKVQVRMRLQALQWNFSNESELHSGNASKGRNIYKIKYDVNKLINQWSWNESH